VKTKQMDRPEGETTTAMGAVLPSAPRSTSGSGGERSKAVPNWAGWNT
jgi:hypothetical protein